MGERVAITAAASRVSEPQGGANGQRERVAALQGFDASGFGSPRGAQIWKEPEEPEDDPAMRILGPHGRLFDALAREVHDAAKLAGLPRERVGLFAGMGMVDSPIGDLLPAAVASRGEDGVDWSAFYGGAYRLIHPLWPLAMLNNVAVGQVSIDLDIRGDNLVLASDADGGLRALLEAANAVRSGTCDAAIAGGVSGRISPAALARLALRGRGDVALGEGGAAFVFEREADARRRGAQILGYVLGGAGAFGASDTAAGPKPVTVERAVHRALPAAGIAAGDVSIVIHHLAGLARGSGSARAEFAGAAVAGLNSALLTGAAALDVGYLGAGAAAYDVFGAFEILGHPELLPPGSKLDMRYGVVIACGAEGGAGALVLEASA